jgi:hypothetical protein
MKKFLITFVLSFIAFYLLEHLVSYVFDIEAELVFERPVKETDLEAVFQAIRKPL